MLRPAAIGLAVLLAACARPTVPLRGADGQIHNVQSATPVEYTEAVERGRTAPLPPKASSAAPTPVSVTTELPWIVDDAPAALALAKAKNLPVFVDVWATWCHSCVHMRAFVLSDAAVRAHASEAVWLSVDADKPANAAFLAGAKVSAYPTFMMLAPGGTEGARWAGTMDAEQVVRFLSGGKVVDDALAAVFKKAETGDNAGCALDGEKLGRTYSDRQRYWDQLALEMVTLQCRAETPDSSVGAQAHHSSAEWNRVLLLAAYHGVRTALHYAQHKTSALEQREHADDISSAYELLVEFERLDDPGPGAQRVGPDRHAGAWVDTLDRFVADAKTSETRAAFDAHRVLAYLAAETPEKAIPMLEQTRRGFPRDFNPPARLAKVYLAMKDYPKARTEAAAALALVDGPRTVRVVTLAADIEKVSGNVRAERKQLEMGIARCKKLWLPPSVENSLAELQKRLSTLPAR